MFLYKKLDNVIMMRAEQVGFFLRQPLVKGAGLVCAAGLGAGIAGGVQSAEAQPLIATGLGDCNKYIANSPNGEYRACFALLENAIGHVTLRIPVGARAPYYAYGRTAHDNDLVKGGAKHHFRTRYRGEARRNIEKEVEAWPAGIRKVQNNVHLLALSVEPKANRALATTLESWQVTDSDGTPRHTEVGQKHHYTLCKAKLPFDPPFEIHLIPEWVVVKDSQFKSGRDPKFNCNAFANQIKRGIIK